MKKLFKAIRQGDLHEVIAILAKNPEAISSIAVPPPKKDIGQSPLQVAVKTEQFEIAYYLMEQGADVDFMEAEAEGVTMWMPILHDAIRTVFFALCYKNIENSKKMLELTEELLKRGADPNKQAFNTFAALDECVSRAESILDNKGAYPDIQDIAEKQLEAVLDLLLKYGADFNEWSNRGHYAGEGETNRELFLDEFKAQPDTVQTVTLRGRTATSVIKGDEDRTAHTRKVMREYCKKHNLL